MSPKYGNSDTVVPIQKTGSSRPYEHPGHGFGRFNFDMEPWENELGALMYSFEGKRGNWDLPLETEYQGGRWEDAQHAESDWERYGQMSPQDQRAKMQAMWGDSNIADTLYSLLQRDAPFKQARRALRPFDTWRSISAGEPEALYNDAIWRMRNK